ncbi:hypothetical protein ACHAXT_006948 [Thalassiosira profunda]
MGYSLSIRGGTAGGSGASKANGVSANSVSNGLLQQSSVVSSSGAPGASALHTPSAPAVSIPPPSSTSAVYQRPNATTLNTSDPASSSANAGNNDLDWFTPSTSTSNGPANFYAQSRDHYTNTDYATQQYQQSSTYSQLSHPYKPSAQYSNARNNQRDQRARFIAAVLGLFSIAFICWVYEYEYASGGAERHHHKEYHHHDEHHDFRSMMGPEDSSIGVASAGRKSYRQLEQEHTTHIPKTDQQGVWTREEMKQHDLFATLPVTTLSNDRILPYVGIGVASHRVEHKQIPLIVSTLLQYASSVTEGGGGIALIDAVVDEERKIEDGGGSMQFSSSNKAVERYEEDEEELESSIAKTVVTLVGQAVGFFGKERKKQRYPVGASGSGGKSDYDYSNRMEVHVLIGLAGPDLGVDNTIAALRDIMAELDGLVPPFPKDMLRTDPSDWKVESAAKPVSDRRVDVRLHVLLGLDHCHNSEFKVAACSLDEATNKDLLDRWIGSYSILEKLYEAKIIHGIGLNGIHAEDIYYLLKRARVVPQLYRGDVEQALDIYGRRMGAFKNEHTARVLKENGITFLASNVAGHILEHKSMAPHAYALLQNLGGVMYRSHYDQLSAHGGDTSMLTTMHKGAGQYYTVPRLVLSYLVRHKVCVLPHAYKAEHLADDAPESVGLLANFISERRIAEVGMALRAILSEEDLPEDHGLGEESEEGVAAVFHNLLQEEVDLKPVGENDAILVSRRHLTVKGGRSIVVIARKGDRFGAFHNFQRRGLYTVTADDGGANDFNIPPGRHVINAGGY